MKIGVLTGGGDVPGLNAAIRAAAARAMENGHDMIGIREGWRGAMEGDYVRLSWADVSNLIGTGGTLLGSSRTNPLRHDGGLKQAIAALERSGIEGLIAIGGDDTLGVAEKLANEGFRTVGVPKTMDNDVGGTDYTIGFFTAAEVAREAVERLRTTARSHRRIMVLEVMGRHAGWVALAAGLGGGADMTLIPELEFDIDDIAGRLHRHYREGYEHGVVVIAEGVKIAGELVADEQRDQFGHARLGGVGEMLAREVKERTGVDTRSTSLGHIQRGGPPVLYDRLLASSLGAYSVDLLEEGESGVLAGWRGERAMAVRLSDALAQPKLVTQDWIKLLCTVQWSVGC